MDGFEPEGAALALAEALRAGGTAAGPRAGR